MEEELMLELLYKGRVYNFDARLVVMGNMHKFIVSINQAEVVFEPGDNRKYNVIVVDKGAANGLVDCGLVFAVGELIRENYG